MRLFFGKPDTNLLLEDLALRYDLLTLKEMFDSCVSGMDQMYLGHMCAISNVLG